MAVIKKYANRRLYDTGVSKFVTLDALAERIVAGEQVQVVDAGSGDDITRSVLSQIVLQQEEDGQGMLPTKLLEQLIRHRNQSVRELLERTLPIAVDATLRMQNEFRAMVEARGDRPGLPPEMVSLMFPWLDFTEAFGRALSGHGGSDASPEAAEGQDNSARQGLLHQIGELRRQLVHLEGRLAGLPGEDEAS